MGLLSLERESAGLEINGWNGRDVHYDGRIWDQYQRRLWNRSREWRFDERRHGR
jgi:hypothetical protein